MWLLTQLSLASALTFFLFQNPANKTQTAGGASGTKTSAEKAETVIPERPVITVHGVCDASKGKGNAVDECTTVITRKEFENLVAVLNPDGRALPPNANKNLAKTYAEYLAVEAAARKAGLEDTPQFRELMNWMRLKTITDLYRRSVQEKYSHPSQQEIDAYYQQHQSEYERVKLSRVLIPREGPETATKDEFDRKALAAANVARESLVKGSDPVQVQKDAYAALGLVTPPPTDLGNRRRADLLPDEAAELFSLQSGDVSKVQKEAKNYAVYKITGKDALPEEQVKNDISREIYGRKFRDAMKSVIDAAPAEYDEQYLEPPAPPKASSTSPPSSSH